METDAGNGGFQHGFQRVCFSGASIHTLDAPLIFQLKGRREFTFLIFFLWLFVRNFFFKLEHQKRRLISYDKPRGIIHVEISIKFD